MWQDPLLVWIPEKYDGVKIAHFSESEIWKPDITVYESIGSEVDPWHNVYLVVNSSGYVRWNPPATLNTICNLDFTNYPREVHECSLTVGSWSYHGEHLDIIIDKNDTEVTNSFLMVQNLNPNWKVLSVTSKREVSRYEEFERMYPAVTVEYVVRLQRRGLGEEDMVALPRAMSILLVLMMFMVPQGIEHASLKLILGTIPLLINVSLIFLVAMNVPAVACLPNSLRGLKAAFGVNIVAVLTQVLLINMSSISTCSPPEWMTNFLKPTFVNVMLCFCGPSSPTTSTLQEDGTTRLVETMDPRKKDWLMLASLLDRLSLAMFLFLFLVTGCFW